MTDRRSVNNIRQFRESICVQSTTFRVSFDINEIVSEAHAAHYTSFRHIARLISDELTATFF